MLLPPASGHRRIAATTLAIAVAVAAVIGAVAFAVISSHGSGGAGTSLAGTSLAGTPTGAAPGFTLRSVYRSGGSVSLGAAGRPVLLSFFASWCTGCQQELHTMAGVTRTAGATGTSGRSVEVIGVDVNDSAGAARALLAADHLSYPVGSDDVGAVSSAYGLVGLPTTVFLDASHRVVGEVVGPLSSSTATSWLGRLGTTGRG